MGTVFFGNFNMRFLPIKIRQDFYSTGSSFSQAFKLIPLRRTSSNITEVELKTPINSPELLCAYIWVCTCWGLKSKHRPRRHVCKNWFLQCFKIFHNRLLLWRDLLEYLTHQQGNTLSLLKQKRANICLFVYTSTHEALFIIPLSRSCSQVWFNCSYDSCLDTINKVNV